MLSLLLCYAAGCVQVDPSSSTVEERLLGLLPCSASTEEAPPLVEKADFLRRTPDVLCLLQEALPQQLVSPWTMPMLLQV